MNKTKPWAKKPPKPQGKPIPLGIFTECRANGMFTEKVTINGRKKKKFQGNVTECKKRNK